MLKAIPKSHITLYLAAITVFGVSLLVFFIPFNIYILGVLIVISLGIIIGMGSLRPAYYALFLLLPFSMELGIGIGDSKILFPSEILIVVLFVAFWIKSLFIQRVNKIFLSHPISVAIIIYLIIMIATTFTSQMPVVSVKYTLINILYVTVFYFSMNYYIRKSETGGLSLFYMYGVSTFFIILYALHNHLGWNFSKGVANIVVHPFFTDHAIYSACLAMLFPAFLFLVIKGKTLGENKTVKRTAFLILTGIIAGLIFSYSRAAWLSLAAAAGVLLIMLLKIKPLYLFTGMMIAGIIFYVQKDSLVNQWKMNRNSSTSKNPTIEEQTKSITNITSDVSNAERLNRWSCVYKMFLDKPITGFGPGTYQFQYLAYQRPSEMTRISVLTAYNNPLGKGGSAHSEYLLALSESGIGGFLSLISIVLLTIYYGMTEFYRQGKKEKIIIVIALLSMITYASHVLFNNYLNVDKTASLFWLSLAIIAGISSKRMSGLKLNPSS
jgi:putative inorganic carbon (hco3(-)) transporter